MPQKPNLTALYTAIDNNNFVILDTETTGLHTGEIVQIALVDHAGALLFESYVGPIHPIPAEATAIHGITNEMVKGVPHWNIVSEQVKPLIQDKDLIVYNALYDRKMMHQSAEACGAPKTDWKMVANWICAMEAYAEFHGLWSEYHQSFQWQRLTVAIEQCGMLPQAAHDARGDCIMTYALIRHMHEIANLPF